MLCSLFASLDLSGRRARSAQFTVCFVGFVLTESQECSVHCLLRWICQDREPGVLSSLFAPLDLSGRRAMRALFTVCFVGFVRTESHESSVHCLLRWICQDGEPGVFCSQFAL